MIRALEHVEQRLESVKANASSHLAGTELRDSLLFFQVVRSYHFPSSFCFIKSYDFEYRLSVNWASRLFALKAV